ncbi:MAG TPA: ABC transporter substrate-binding protein, partial [Acetobacteraceae bacterium]|nr:ABC transporter substrate-binding protein [Acetobacteraceae bacterium]
PLMNGIVDYDFWQPVKSYRTPEALAFLAKYQAKAAAEGVDALGYYLPPFAYADMQVIGEAVEKTGSANPDKLAAYLRSHTFHTIAGDVAFGANGEWKVPRVMAVQFQGVQGHDIDQFKDAKTEVVLWPPDLKTGDIRYPYDEAKH